MGEEVSSANTGLNGVGAPIGTMAAHYHGPMGSTVSSQPSATPQTELEREAVRMNNTRDALVATVQRLEARLEHVLHPDSPKEQSEKVAENEPSTTLGKLLREESEGINRVIRRVINLTDRLGV